MKYSMFIGRWQPWHEGHRWLIDQRLNQKKNVLICIREVSQDDSNPLHYYIDWRGWADAVAMDYNQTEFDGDNYYWRV